LVAEQPKLLIGIALRPGTSNPPGISEVMTALINALEWLGVCAKTALGYGSFCEFDKPHHIEHSGMTWQDVIVSLTPSEIATKFSRDRTATKREYDKQRIPWKNVIIEVWSQHKVTLNSFKNSERDNERDCVRRLIKWQNEFKGK